MKKNHFIIAIVLIICSLFTLAFSACGGPRLESPSQLTLDEATLVLSWDKIENARYYEIVIDGEGRNDETRESTKASIDLSKLSEGSYVITVIACSNSDEWSDSRPSEKFTFTREHELGFTFTLTDNKSAYTLSALGTADGGEDGTFIVPDTYRGKPVTEIGSKAFFNQGSVKKVVLGNNVTRIGKQAFANCTSLASIEFSQVLESVDASAFQACKGLVGELKIPDSVKTLGEYAFASCEKLTSLSIGKGVTNIPPNCFLNCKGLTKLVIPQNVQSIEEYAFSDNYAVEELVVENGLQTIGNYAFAHNRALMKVVLPDSVATLGEGAFTNCEALSDVTFGSGVASVGVNAFFKSGLFNNTPKGQPVYAANWFVGYNTLDEEGKSHPELVTEVVLKDTTVGIADQALMNHTAFQTVTLPDSVKIIGYKAFANCKMNTVKLGCGVTTIAERAFTSCVNLQLVALGTYNELSGTVTDSSLQTIGDYAFYKCEALKQIKIPDTVEKIGLYAFRGTLMYSSQSGIIYAAEFDSSTQTYKYEGAWVVDNASATMRADMELADGVVGIADYSFYKSTVLKSLVVPETVRYIGRSAFYSCTALEELELPAAVTRIEDYTFYDCSALKLLTLPDGLTYIGRSAFYKALLGSVTNDTDTDTLVIPDAVTYIGDYAFYGIGTVNLLNTDENSDLPVAEDPCGIDKIVIGDGVAYIGARAFYASNTLKEVVFGNGLTTLGERAFYNCKLLESITFPEDSVLQTISNNAFYGCVSLKALELPDSVKTVEKNAFYKCSGMTTLALGSVENIGQAAFYGCSGLTALHLPESVRLIDKQAFRNCAGLLGVALESDETIVEAHAFYGCANATIYASSAEAGENWKTSWNSTYCPIIWGCTLSEDGTYVYAVTKTERFVTQKDMSKTLTAPARDGYEFVGWAYAPEGVTADVSMEELLTVADGTTLYAVWAEK